MATSEDKADIVDHQEPLFYSYYVRFEEMLMYPILLAICLLAVQKVLERFIFRPVGNFLDVSSNPPELAPEDQILEKHYQQKSPMEKMLKQVEGMDQATIELWLKTRKSVDTRTQLDKFSESCWKLTYYSMSVIMGATAMYDKPWLYDLKMTVVDIEHHVVEPQVWRYFTSTMVLNSSLLIALLFNSKRKDFWELLIHHLLAIALFETACSLTLVRGASVLYLLHDVADPILELTKLLHYTGQRKLNQKFCIAFSIVFIVTRIVIFPFIVLETTFYEPNIVILNVFLICLFCLHIYWTMCILTLLYRQFVPSKNGKL